MTHMISLYRNGSNRNADKGAVLEMGIRLATRTDSYVVTRTDLGSGKSSYSIISPAGVASTLVKSSTRSYGAASLYTVPSTGEVVAFLHRDLIVAAKGSADAKRAGFVKFATVEVV